MVNEESQKTLHDQWINAKINCKPDADKDGIGHVVIVIEANVDGDDCFKYIHTVNVSEEQTKANSHFCWWLIKHEVIDGQCDRSREVAPKTRRTSTSQDAGDNMQIGES